MSKQFEEMNFAELTRVVTNAQKQGRRIKCEKCKFRIRGGRHFEGMHHKGLVIRKRK